MGDGKGAEGATSANNKVKTMRCLRSFIWVDPGDCDPPHGLDMQGERDANKVAMLYEAFVNHGFDLDQPALVGYPCNGRIQLLSGTHRHEAAKQANIRLPVTLWLSSDIMETWGTELWEETIRDIPVRELQTYPIKEGFYRSPYDPVDPSNFNE